MERVAILLVLYNDHQHVRRLIKSIQNQTYKQIEIYAIECSYSGESIELIKQLYSLTITFPYKGNLGFAQGNNFLAEKAIEDGTDFLFILNTDMELSNNCIEELVKTIKQNKHIEGVAPIVLSGRNNERTPVIQRYVSNFNFDSGKLKSHYINLDLNDKRIPEFRLVNTILGGVTFLSAKLYKEVGLFNTDNFMYGDERDISYRISQTNYKLAVTKKANVWHFHDWSKKNKSRYNIEYYYIKRNKLLYFHRYGKYIMIIIDILKEIINLPRKIRWALKIADIKLLKYYYLGLLHGVLNKKGKSNLRF